MPYVDPSIIQGYAPIELPDQGNLLLKALQIQSARGQNRLQDLQIGQAQQSADQTNALMDALRDPSFSTLDSQGQRNRVLQVAPIAGQNYVKGLLDTQKTQGEIQSTTLGNADKGRTAVASLAGALSGKENLSPDDLSRFQQEAGKLGVQINLADFAGPAGVDSARAALKRYQLQGMTAEQQQAQINPTILPTDAGIAAVNKDGSGGRMVPNITGAASYANGSPGVGPGIAGASAGQPLNVPWTGPEPTLKPGGNFAGDPQALVAQLSRITDPNDRAAALRTLQLQLQASGQPMPTMPVGVGPQGQAGAQAGAPQVIGAKPQGEWKSDPLNGGFVFLDKYGTPGQVASGGTDAMISAAAIDNAAKRYNLDGTLPPMGMGMAGSQGRKQILDRAAELAQGVDGTDQRVNQLGNKANTAALSKIQQQQTMVGAFERNFTANADLALEQSTKVDRTGIPLVNKWINAGKRAGTGDPDLSAYDAVIKSVSNEYAKIVSGSMGNTAIAEGEIKKIESLLNSAQTPEQVAAVINMMKKETANRMAGIEAEKQSLRSQMGGSSGHGGGMAPVAAPASSNGWSIQKVN